MVSAPVLRFCRRWAVPVGLLLVTAGAAATLPVWLPMARARLADWRPAPGRSNAAASGAQPGHDHDHGQAGHAEASSIELSAQALRNISFQPLTIAPTAFVRTITVPAMVVERPGRSQIHVTAPLTGVVTKIVPIRGAAVVPGSPMFDIRLTHEELVAAQGNLLRTAESLEVVRREIDRLRALGEGVVAGKRILEQEYEKQKLEAGLRAERQALLLHGLDEPQVDAILRERTLLQTLTVTAPPHGDDSDDCREDHLYHVQELPVKPGQQVEAGQVLCVLADHCELYLEGSAFEDDAPRLREAAHKGWNISAVLLVGERATEEIQGLKLLYLADHVDAQSRAFRFYLRLPNVVTLDQQDAQGHRFLSWRFKPGQRLELRVPVERWEARLVLPVEAVVEEGAESYVYRQDGDHFERVPVHVEYREQRRVVIANDGAVFRGDIVAARGAYQMHLALKNKAGGGVDPHAGHSH